MLTTRFAEWPAEHTGVIGSSLGGFYACVIAERFRLPRRAAEPCGRAGADLARHIGEITAWHSDDRFFFRAEFIGRAARDVSAGA